ncbi:hypothetical protein ASG29_08790 [Sphingomonas sp. Leaf412]|nr:hypothetical protein ASG29_08790 [Sphingomonas sp. Leaf412]
MAVWGAVVLAGGVLAAQAGLRLLAPVPAPPPAAIDRAIPAAPRPAPSPPASYALASPARGVTGTTPLPPLPIAGSAPTTAPARAFSLSGIAPVDRGRALDCLATAVYYEAASESDAGQQAVAQVVLNRVRHPAFPATICGVVYQGSERSVCQFSFACDGAMARAPARGGWARATRNAAAVLNGLVYTPVGLATHYHTFAVTPAWNRTLVMTDAVGAHFFHRWKGFWGTAAAFVQRYRGGEPVPGPHLRSTQAVPEAATTPPAPPPPDMRDRYVTSGAPLAPVAPEQRLPESTILDRWKDSGRPLR